MNLQDPALQVHPHGEENDVSQSGEPSASGPVLPRKKPPPKQPPSAALPVHRGVASASTTASSVTRVDSSVSTAEAPVDPAERASLLLAQRLAAADAAVTNIPTGAAAGVEPPTGPEDDQKPAAVDERMLMAQSLGIDGCDFTQSPFNKHPNMCTPRRPNLMKELKRRIALRGIKITKATRHEYPNLHSPPEDMAQWLRKNPIQDQDEVRNVKDDVEKLKMRINAAPPRNKNAVASLKDDKDYEEGEEDVKPKARGKRRSNKQNNKKSNKKSNNGDDQKMSAQSSGPSDDMPSIKVTENNTDSTMVNTNHCQGNKDDGTPTREDAHTMIPNDDGEFLRPKDLMTRALGLPGCNFQHEPFKSYPKDCTPTKQQLYNEVKRRCGIVGIDLRTGGDRSLLPTRHTLKKDLVLWLIGNPIPKNHTDVGGLLFQVESLRMGLESGDSFRNHGDSEDPVIPEEEKEPTQPTGRDPSDENDSERENS